MKKVLTLLGLLMVAFLTGCKDKCDGYAPKGTELSKTDYNTVSQVCAFYSHHKTAEAHMNDTVLLCGYVLENYDYDSAYHHAEWGYLSLFMADTPTIDKYEWDIIQLNGDTASMSWLLNYTFGQKMYFKVFCYAANPMDDGGCEWTVGADLISVDERSWR